MEEGVGNAPTSARADPVFETGAASLYLPAFLKFRMENDECRISERAVLFCALHSAFCIGMAARLGLAPRQAV